MMAVKKGTAFENLKNSFSLFRVPEEEIAEKSPLIDEEESTQTSEKDVEVNFKG